MATSEIISIIMAAGKGTRMENTRRHKVCFPVAGIPAIVRAIETYNACGVTRHCVVVGHRADQVMKTVSAKFDNVFFVRQPRPIGTGNAVTIAAKKLQQMGVGGSVLVVAGDKVIQPSAIQRLVKIFREQNADLAFVTGPRKDSPDAGVVVLDAARRPVANVEVKELARARAERRVFQFASGQRFTPAEINRFTEANLSVYLFKAESLFAGLKQIPSATKTRETYFTDIIEMLAADEKRVVPVPVINQTEVMAFNSPKELAAIERVYRKERTPRIEFKPSTALHTADEWLATFSQRGFQRRIELVRGFAQRFGDKTKFAIIRSPGRVNLMGRHIDHQGGPTNVLAIDREVLIAAAPRKDGRVRLFNSDESDFPPRSFQITEEIAKLDWHDWPSVVNGSGLRKQLAATRGDWVNYVKGAMLRLQSEFPRKRLGGMDMFVAGNIPAGSGLSSSSSLVVAVAATTLALNGLELKPHRFVEMCSEAEWFVGTRGGATDHAAITFGREGTVLHVGFFPLRILRTAPFFTKHSIVICNSGEVARKSEEARTVYNERIASYVIGRALLRRRFAKHGGIEHLSEVHPQKLRCPMREIYRTLARLPRTLPLVEARAWCKTFESDERAVLEPLLEAAEKSAAFPVRDVCLFGIAEAARARHAIEFLAKGDAVRFGKLMQISHDGDRVREPNGEARQWSLSDAAFKRLVNQAPPLWQQPGGYACSTERIDRIVDAAMVLPGVFGAQLVGAGLGGCVAILTRKNHADTVVKTFRRMGFETEKLVSAAGVSALRTD